MTEGEGVRFYACNTLAPHIWGSSNNIRVADGSCASAVGNMASWERRCAAVVSTCL